MAESYAIKRGASSRDSRLRQATCAERFYFSLVKELSPLVTRGISRLPHIRIADYVLRHSVEKGGSRRRHRTHPNHPTRIHTQVQDLGRVYSKTSAQFIEAAVKRPLIAKTAIAIPPRARLRGVLFKSRQATRKPPRPRQSSLRLRRLKQRRNMRFAAAQIVLEFFREAVRH
jgi:hypothetical protein